MPRKPLPEIVTHAQELFAPLGTMRVKPMFGGWGFYADELFFALIAWKTLYLKADEESQDAFEAAGSEPFIYQRSDGKAFKMGYWTVPDDALDSPATIAPWAWRAIDCALRHRKPARKKKF